MHLHKTTSHRFQEHRCIEHHFIILSLFHLKVYSNVSLNTHTHTHKSGTAWQVAKSSRRLLVLLTEVLVGNNGESTAHPSQAGSRVATVKMNTWLSCTGTWWFTDTDNHWGTWRKPWLTYCTGGIQEKTEKTVWRWWMDWAVLIRLQAPAALLPPIQHLGKVSVCAVWTEMQIWRQWLGSLSPPAIAKSN